MHNGNLQKVETRATVSRVSGNSGHLQIEWAVKPLAQGNKLTNMKTNRKMITVTVAALAILSFPTLRAADPMEPGKEVKTEETKPAVKPYPINTCIVSGEKLGEMGKPFVFVYQGQEIKLCCKDCKKKFDKDPATYLKKLGDK